VWWVSVCLPACLPDKKAWLCTRVFLFATRGHLSAYAFYGYTCMDERTRELILALSGRLESVDASKPCEPSLRCAASTAWAYHCDGCSSTKRNDRRGSLLPCSSAAVLLSLRVVGTWRVLVTVWNV